MANDLAGNPLIIDTAGVVDATLVYRVRKITFRGAAVGDAAVVGNGAGRETFRLVTPLGGYPDEIDFGSNPFPVKGLNVASLSASGVIHVYIGE